MGGPAVWWEITKTPREPFISKFEMEDKSSSAASDHQHKVTHNRFRTDMMTIGGKMTYMTLAAKYRTSAAGRAAMQEKDLIPALVNWYGTPPRRNAYGCTNTPA